MSIITEATGIPEYLIEIQKDLSCQGFYSGVGKEGEKWVLVASPDADTLTQMAKRTFTPYTSYYWYPSYYNLQTLAMPIAKGKRRESQKRNSSVFARIAKEHMQFWHVRRNW